MYVSRSQIVPLYPSFSSIERLAPYARFLRRSGRFCSYSSPPPILCARREEDVLTSRVFLSVFRSRPKFFDVAGTLDVNISIRSANTIPVLPSTSSS